MIGLREDVQEFKVADLRGTHWTHVFVESRGKNRKLMPGSSFLFCEYIYAIIICFCFRKLRSVLTYS